jgi:cold shock CspA family protein
MPGDFWLCIAALAATIDGNPMQCEEALDRMERDLKQATNDKRNEMRDRMSVIVAQLARLELRMREAYGPGAESINRSAPQSETPSQTYEGTVKDVLASQGFGFLKRDDGKPNIYFHCTDLVEALVWDKALRGRRVRFEIVETQKGARAVAVRKAE